MSRLEDVVMAPVLERWGDVSWVDSVPPRRSGAPEKGRQNPDWVVWAATLAKSRPGWWLRLGPIAIQSTAGQYTARMQKYGVLCHSRLEGDGEYFLYVGANES